MGKQYIILTSKSCGRCMVVKKILTEKGKSFTEVDVASPEGQQLATTQNIMSAGAIVDVQAQKVVQLNELDSEPACEDCNF